MPAAPTVAGVPERFDFLDGMRGVSALYVAGCHAYLTCSGLYWAQATSGVERGLLYGLHWLSFGRSAVAVFIVISGYCLMAPVVRAPRAEISGGLTRFFLRRARRILPPYYAALVASLALLWFVPALQPRPGDPWYEGFWLQVYPAFEPGVLLSHFLLLHNYHPDWQHAINYPMWSIATEWQIYALFPVFVAIWRRNWRSGVVMNALRLTLLLQLSLVFFAPGHNPWPPVFVALFSFGMAAAALHGVAATEPVDAQAWDRRALAALLVYVALEATVGEWLLASGHQQILDFLAGGGAAALMIACAERVRAQTGRSWAHRVLESRFATILGSFSYSLYLLHAPVLALVFVTLRGADMPPAVVLITLTTLGVLLSCVVASVFSLVFERPFVRHRRSNA